jgi:translation initiation factor 3 subunit M
MTGGTALDLGQDLVTYVNKIVSGGDIQADFFKECKAFVDDGNQPSIVKKVIEQKDKLFAESSDADTEGCFSILASLISGFVKDQADRKELVDLFTAAVTDSNSDKPTLRLKIVSNLYNLLEPKSTERFNVFMVLARYASESDQLNLVYRYVKNVDPKSWDLQLSETRSLFKLMSEITSESDDQEIRATSQAFIVKLLATYEGQDDLSEVKEFAAKGVVGAIKSAVSSFTTSESLIEFAAVKQLEGDGTYKRTYELLKVFSTGNVEEYTAFHKKNSAFMQEQGIEHETAMENMRLLSICSLASSHEEIPYAEIAKVLKISEDEVEDWVVKAISAKLMDAKMDQLGQVVIINRCSQRIFGQGEWKQLGEKLTAWKENVRTMLSTIENSTKEN